MIVGPTRRWEQPSGLPDFGASLAGCCDVSTSILYPDKERANSIYGLNPFAKTRFAMKCPSLR